MSDNEIDEGLSILSCDARKSLPYIALKDSTKIMILIKLALKLAASALNASFYTFFS